MIRTVEAIIDEQGHIRLLEAVRINGQHRALVTILDEQPSLDTTEWLRVSEPALAQDWNRPEEDAAWSHLLPDQSS